MSLSSCPSCQGFNPATRATCLHCGRAFSRLPLRRWGTSLWMAAGASITAITLMACYGAPPCADGSFDCQGPDQEDLDAGTDAGTDAGLSDGGLSDGGR
jgi:hypothetical protein